MSEKIVILDDFGFDLRVPKLQENNRHSLKLRQTNITRGEWNQMEKAKPVEKYSKGNLTIAKWLNKFPDGTPYESYTIAKSYKDKKTGEWKESKSFSSTEIIELKNLIVDMLNSRTMKKE